MRQKRGSARASGWRKRALLTAGLAHELNNPALRGAQRSHDLDAAVDAYVSALGDAGRGATDRT